jgi:xanthine dehydrogenase accessory factor
MFNDTVVWVRGAGELGSAVAHLLHRVGLSVFLSEISPPLAIRRPVTFSDAILEGSSEVEGITGKYTADYVLPVNKPWSYIPVFTDNPEAIWKLKPTILIDARILKYYEQDYRTWAQLVIGLGPGFNTDQHCHQIIETMRGHELARIIYSGESMRDTGIPGVVGGETSRRIIRAPESGRINWNVNFGDIVPKQQILGTMDNGQPIRSPLQGMIRGLISPKVDVSTGMKIGDVDPRGGTIKYLQISEKARAVACGVLEAIFVHMNQVGK